MPTKVMESGRFEHGVVSALKRAWIRTMSRGIRHSGNHARIDRMYLMSDPWQMSSPTEEYRFAAMNDVISDNFGRPRSILEIGCGEGHQSIYLRRVSDRVIGLDVSARAVARARERLPNNEFVVGTIFSSEVDTYAPFDLIVASEVLYYMKDIPAVLARMRELSSANLVSYYSDEMANLDPQVLSIPNAEAKTVTFGATQWRVVWWPKS